LLADISADAHRAGDVIKGIRSMVKKGEIVRTQVNINDLVSNVVRMVNSEASLHSCEVTTFLQPDLPLVNADPVELQQVMLNLVVNAFDALRGIPESNRKIRIATKTNKAGEVEVGVHDSGAGIPKDARKRLFEQFFTTKTGGLGLGLAIARSIIESHGGRITGTNVGGGGAEFRFTLPST
jgi:two-component system sensor kinase FixL